MANSLRVVHNPEPGEPMSHWEVSDCCLEIEVDGDLVETFVEEDWPNRVLIFENAKVRVSTGDTKEYKGLPRYG